MTFVTLIPEALDVQTMLNWRHDQRKEKQSWKRGVSELFCRVQFGFESLPVADGHAASIYFQHPFGLETGKITRNKFAHGANL